MFSSLGLFQSLPCPHKSSCTRQNCLFSHSPHVVEKSLHIPYDVPQPVASSSKSSVPAKRPAAPSPSPSSGGLAQEPPRKLQKLGISRKAVTSPALSGNASPPVLRLNAGQSKVPISTRQAMLKSLYDHFIVLYDAVVDQQPSLPAEHALRQEQEIYARTTKLTYRNAVITSIATLKTRPPPTSLSHSSIGTADDLKSRPAVPTTPSASPLYHAAPPLSHVRLTPSILAPFLLTSQELVRWNYMTAIPDAWGPGGEAPSALGTRATCERCRVVYVVQESQGSEECSYHWGKLMSVSVNGERMRTYTCCSRPSDAGGCAAGPHVFYESAPQALHSRFPFSFTQPAEGGGPPLEVAALDCEMVYTTGGFRIARVSVVDGSGKEVFDEIVRMDDGVEVVDFNTRFSGLTPEIYAARAVLPLAAVRTALCALISADTILMGHALDNDLRALRMVHMRCVDTVVLFVHPRGWPYRKALRDLTKEFLGRSIQTGDGTVGHSSVEDSVATLDLVKWFVLNKRTKPKMVGLGAPDAAQPAKVGAQEVKV